MHSNGDSPSVKGGNPTTSTDSAPADSRFPTTPDYSDGRLKPLHGITVPPKFASAVRHITDGAFRLYGIILYVCEDVPEGCPEDRPTLARLSDLPVDQIKPLTAELFALGLIRSSGDLLVPVTEGA